MKFFKFFKRGIENTQVISISDKDLNFLAAMCYRCEPKIVKKGIITRRYAYYVPQTEIFLDIIKQVFARNGILMQEHLSNISGFHKQKVLRIDYADVKNPDKLKKEMKRIKNMLDSGFLFSNRTEEKQR